MKSKIILSIFALLVINVSAQYNPQLIDTTKCWSTIDEYTAGGGVPYSFYNKFADDTLIGNINYYKVFTSYDEYMADWELTGFIRENDNKIYLRNLSNDEGLIYDFGAQVDDTIHINNNLSFWAGWQLDVVVSSIDSIYVEPAGEYRKSILVRETALPNPLYETWIEGIGSEAGVLFSGFKIMGATGTIYSLQCFFEDEILIYKNPSHSVCFYPLIGIPTINQIEGYISIFPNPLHTQSTIFLNKPYNENIEIEVRDIHGKLILKFQDIQTNEIILNRSQLSSGVYIITINNKNEIIARKKLLVQ